MQVEKKKRESESWSGETCCSYVCVQGTPKDDTAENGPSSTCKPFSVLPQQSRREVSVAHIEDITLCVPLEEEKVIFRRPLL